MVIKKKRDIKLKWWRIKTEFGKEMVCNENSYLYIKRNGKEMKVKPHEIMDGDSIMCVDD